MQSKHDDDRSKRGQSLTEEQIRQLKTIALVIGLGVLVVWWWRRRGHEAAPLVAPVLALVGAQAMASLDADRIRRALQTAAKTQSMLTPTELFEALKAAGYHWDSPSHMGIQLARLGIRSQVHTVEGRTDRRWYDLSNIVGPTEATAA